MQAHNDNPEKFIRMNKKTSVEKAVRKLDGEVSPDLFGTCTVSQCCRWRCWCDAYRASRPICSPLAVRHKHCSRLYSKRRVVFLSLTRNPSLCLPRTFCCGPRFPPLFSLTRLPSPVFPPEPWSAPSFARFLSFLGTPVSRFAHDT